MNTLVQRRKVVRQKTTRLQTFLDTVNTAQVSQIDIEIRLEKLEECSNQFNEVQNEIEAACANDEELDAQDGEREAFETKYYAIKSGLLKLLKETSTPGTSTLVAKGTTAGTADIKLPKLDLPVVSGNYQEWFSFHDLFTAVVHNNVSLTSAQKFHYLKLSLKGEAARLLLSMQVTDSNYDEAWKILIDRYQNTRQIISSHLKSLFSQATLNHESASGLRKLLDTTIEHMRALHVLGQPTNHWDSILVHIVVERLDADSRRQWELSTATSTLPSFEELKSFLEQRCRALEAAGGNKVKTTQQNVSGKPAATRNTHMSYHASVKPNSSCIMCKSNHLVYQCPVFAQKSVTERTSLARQHMVCFNCLRSGHASKSCRSGTCRKCHGKHHTLLHFEHPAMEDVHAKPATSTTNSMTSMTKPVTGTESGFLTTQVLLYTAKINVMDSFGRSQLCRALLDSGSQCSFISEPCIQRLGLSRKKTNKPINGIGGVESGLARGTTRLQISSLVHNYSFGVDVFILPKITGLLPSSPIDSSHWGHLRDLALADPTFHQPGQVDILFGADVFAELMLDGTIRGIAESPVAQRTVFGWILSGKVNSRGITNHGAQSNLALMDLDSSLRKFGENEELPQTKTLTSEERYCESHFGDTHTRDSTGQFMVKLPFKKDSPALGQSRTSAVKRLQSMERRLLQNQVLKHGYHEFIDEYQHLDHMESIPTGHATTTDCMFYLPHHAIIKDTSTTTKLRVVFDGSAKSSTGVSLNGILLVGPKLQDDLINILLRFRMHKIAMVADIAKMYRQIQVHQDDRDYQRIVWRSSEQEEIQDFRLTTVTYGTASAPYLAIKCLQQLALEASSEFSDAAKAILNDFYVDDLMSGEEDVPSALKLQTQLISLLENGHFHLRKWLSNAPELLEAVSSTDRDTGLSLALDKNNSIKTLGLLWHPLDDEFSFEIQNAHGVTFKTFHA